VLQRSNPANLMQWLQEHLGPILVAIFVFVLPAVRAAIAAKKQKDELARRGEAPPAESAGRTWEELLEGSDETPPPLPTPVPVPVPARGPEFTEEESLEEHRPPPMLELPSGSATESEDESEAEAYVDARERQESERQQQVAAAQYTGATPLQPEVAAPPAAAAQSWLFPTEPARDRKTALRRAIVLREVLGPPLALR
jgi:hypothetical protein